MPFKFKLSMRLALMRSAFVLLPAALIFACTMGDQSVSGPAKPSTVTMAPTPGTVLLQENFQDNAFAGRGWYDNTAMAVTDTQHVAGSTHALEVHFLPGATQPTWGGAARYLFTASSTLYLSYWVKYSANWIGSGRLYHPHEFYVLSDLDGAYDGPSNNWLTLYIEHNYQNGGIPRLALQDNKAINTSYGAPPINLISVTENRSTGGCNGVVEPQLASECYNAPPWYNDKKIDAALPYFSPTAGSPAYKGNWNHVEAYFQLNSIVAGIGRADGVMQYWFNGTLVIDRHAILFRTGARPTINFHQFIIAPYIGDGSPADQTMWVDNLVLATAPLVSSATVASVAVSPVSASVGVGATVQLAATLKDSAGNVLTGQPVTWTSSNTATATVNSAGLVAGVAAGTATMTASSGAASSSAAVTVTPGVTNPGTVTDLAVAGAIDTSVTLSFTEVNDGTGLPASYNIRFAPGTLSWGSATDVTRGTCAVPLLGTAIGAKRTCTVNGLSAATAYQLQLVTYRGTLNVNAVFGGLSNVASGTTLATTAPVAAVSVAPASATLAVGSTQAFTATLKDATGNILTGRSVAWASSNAAVATVSGSTATAVSVGAATISATSGGITGGAALTVSSTVAVASVAVSPTSLSQAVGATKQVSVTLKDASGNVLTGRTVTWASSNTAVATVSASGLEKGITSGSATITATAEGKSGTTAVTVTVSKPGTVSNLSVGAATNNSATLSFTEVGDGTGHPANYEVRFAAGTIAWGSAADVSQGTCAVPFLGTTIGARRSCTVLGLAPAKAYQFQLVAYRGTLNLNAVFGALSNIASGTTASSTAAVASVTVTPASASLAVGATQQLSTTLKDAGGNTLTGRTITWASNAGTIAVVSGTGLATGMAAGNATITATSEGINGTAAVAVSAVPPPPSGSTWPNEPAGWTAVNDYGMNALNAGGWANVYPADITSGGISVTSDATAPASPSAVWQFSYPNGFTSAGNAPATEWTTITPAQSLYVGFWWKPSNPWQGHSSGVNKIMFMFTGDPAGLSQNMTIQMYGSGNGPFSTRMVGEGFEDVAYNENVGSTSPLALGTWHRVEILMNSPTASLRWWVDGNLIGSYSGVPYPSYGFFQLEFSPTWGGVGGSNKTENDDFWFDQVHVSHP